MPKSARTCHNSDTEIKCNFVYPSINPNNRDDAPAGNDLSLAVGSRVHMIGIGGCGMCGAAAVLLRGSVVVSGSDRGGSKTLLNLAEQGAAVYVGQSADTPAFAVDNVARWCQTELRTRYPDATELFIEADAGGSNGYRSRVWKHDLQTKIADAFGLTVTVCHYPTGTSKWNPIEHRGFSEISKTWAGCPLRSFVPQPW